MEDGKGVCVRRGRRSREEDRRFNHALVVDTDPQYVLVASHSIAQYRTVSHLFVQRSENLGVAVTLAVAAVARRRVHGGGFGHKRRQAGDGGVCLGG